MADPTRRPLARDRALLGLTMAAAAGVVGAGYLAAMRPRWSFSGRTAIVTGGGRGLGLALARRLAAEGAHVVLIARDEAELIRARDDLRTRGGAADIFKCDVRDPDAVRDTVARILRQTRRIDVLVNNAGVIQMMPFEHAEDADFDESLQTHFWGPLHMVRACLPHLAPGARILNISSIGGRVAVPHLLPYCAGKFALSALSDGLHEELAKDGILVTTATPGLMRTGSHRNVVVRGDHRHEAQWFALVGATSATSMNVNRAARKILDACRKGRARVTPGLQARMLELFDRIAPNTTARLMAATTRYALPKPPARDESSRARWSRDLDLGWMTSLFPTGAAADLNQPLALGERVR